MLWSDFAEGGPASGTHVLSELLKALRPQVRSGGLDSLCPVTRWPCDLAVCLPVCLRGGVGRTREAPGLAPVTRNRERGPTHVAAPVETERARPQAPRRLASRRSPPSLGCRLKPLAEPSRHFEGDPPRA